MMKYGIIEPNRAKQKLITKNNRKKSDERTLILAPNLDELYRRPIAGMSAAKKQQPLPNPHNKSYALPSAIKNTQYPSKLERAKLTIIRKTLGFIWKKVLVAVLKPQF